MRWRALKIYLITTEEGFTKVQIRESTNDRAKPWRLFGPNGLAGKGRRRRRSLAHPGNAGVGRHRLASAGPSHRCRRPRARQSWLFFGLRGDDNLRAPKFANDAPPNRYDALVSSRHRALSCRWLLHHEEYGHK
jgi:hypothetical protein